MPIVTVDPKKKAGLQAFRVVATKPTADVKFGVTCQSEDGIVTVISLDKESILYKGGMLKGDEIVNVNGTNVTMAHEVTDILKAAVGEVVLLVQGMPSLERKKPASFAGDPLAAGATPPASKPAAAAAATGGEGDKTYDLEVPPNAGPGSKLKLTIPGMTDKVIITVPEGAAPGATISFTLKAGAGAKDAPSGGGAAPADGAADPAPAGTSEEMKAAVQIQARLRGKSVRLNPGKKLDTSALPESEIVPVAPMYHGETALKEQPAATAPSTPVKKAPPAPMLGDTAAPGSGVGGFLKRSFASLAGVLGSAPAMAASGKESSSAYELFGLATSIMSAWEGADFDTFVALSLPNVVLHLPDMEAEGAQGVWDARHEHTHEGVLSLDTMMAQVDDDGMGATVVCLERIHDTDSSGMAISHAWLRLTFEKAAGGNGNGHGDAAGEGAGAGWKLAQLERDSIWSGGILGSLADEAASDENRLGMGRTLRACTDVSSLSSVLLTAWVAGDRNRFESVVAPDASVTIRALDIAASSASAAFDCRDKLLKHGNLISFNSPMVDAESAPGGTINVLAHAHLFDVSSGSSLGQPTAHLALQLSFAPDRAGEIHLTKLVSDVMWLGEGRMPETEGLSFEAPPLNSIYTRALTFIKSWETSGEDGITSLSTKKVALEVMSGDEVITPETSGIGELLEYRKGLGELGMLTVDSVKVTPTSFEAVVHEYGIEINQHGLPRKHESVKLSFEPQRDGSMLVSKVYFDLKYFRKAKRASLTMDQDVNLAAEL